MYGLFSELKIAFVDCDLTSSVEGTVNAILEACRKILVLYDLRSEMGNVAFLMDWGKCLLLIIRKRLCLENSCIYSTWKDAIDLLLDYLFPDCKYLVLIWRVRNFNYL